MNDKRDFDRAVDRWLDDGSDATPPGVIDAVLLAARSTPQERDFRISWRTTPMKRLAYAAAVVAAVAVGVTALSVLNPRFGIGSDPTPTPIASAPTGCTGISASGEALTVGWCPTRPDGQQVLVAFRLSTTSAAAWLNGNESRSQEALFFRPYGAGVEPGGTVAISVGGPATLEAWLALITGETAYTVSEPQPISLSGADGYVVDVSMAPGHVEIGDAPPLIENGALSWRLGDSTSRIWLVDHDGQAVMFVTRPVGGDQSWARWVGDQLQTIEWD
jgi:hypothetical protein